MACTDPGTTSPGFIAINYAHTSQAVQHRTRVRLHYGVDPADTVAMTFLANSWAAVIQPCLFNGFTLTDWATFDENGTSVISGIFASPYVGTHTSASGAEDYRSRTVSFTGRGQSLVAGECVGEARMVLFVGSSYNFTPGQKFVTTGTDASLDALAAFLDNHAVLWSDFYGHFAGCRGRYPVQLNAATQRRSGS